MLGRPDSDEMRDHGPLIETEDFRDEGARGIWDDFSPPHFGFKKGRNGQLQLEFRNLRSCRHPPLFQFRLQPH